MKNDALGDACKDLESQESGRKFLPGLPILMRLDGRAFHTYTRGMRRPYDEGMQASMIAATTALVDDLHPCIAYTQSDEITLLFSGDLFNRRIMKMATVAAGLCSAAFAVSASNGADKLPHFDCRAWQVPTREDALDVFVWREDDAVKNSLSMAAQSVYSGKELHGKNGVAQHDMLHAKGINWNDYPPHFKRGVYLRRVAEERTLTAEEIARIPERFRPTGPVIRTSVNVLDMPPIRRIGNAIEVLFNGALPVQRQAT